MPLPGEMLFLLPGNPHGPYLSHILDFLFPAASTGRNHSSREEEGQRVGVGVREPALLTGRVPSERCWIQTSSIQTTPRPLRGPPHGQCSRLLDSSTYQCEKPGSSRLPEHLFPDTCFPAHGNFVLTTHTDSQGPAAAVSALPPPKVAGTMRSSSMVSTHLGCGRRPGRECQQTDTPP